MKADKSLNDELIKHWYYEKHAPRVSQVIAAVAKVSCKHGLWLVARVNYTRELVTRKLLSYEYNKSDSLQSQVK